MVYVFNHSHTVTSSSLFLYRIPLQSRSSGKFLGFLQLTQKEHILSFKKKCSPPSLPTTNSFLCVCLGMLIVRHFFTYMLPWSFLLNYRCHVYYLDIAFLLNLLDPVHHLGLYLPLGAFSSSPVESLHAESGLSSLSRRPILLSFGVLLDFINYRIWRHIGRTGI